MERCTGHRTAEIQGLRPEFRAVDQDVVIDLISRATMHHHAAVGGAGDEITINLGVVDVVVEVDTPAEVLAGDEACRRCGYTTGVDDLVITDDVA